MIAVARLKWASFGNAERLNPPADRFQDWQHRILDELGAIIGTAKAYFSTSKGRGNSPRWLAN